MAEWAQVGGAVLGHVTDGMRAARPHVQAATDTLGKGVVDGAKKLSTHIQTNGWVGTAKHIAKTRPLLTGAAAVTSAYVAGTAVFGGNHRRYADQSAGYDRGR